MASHYGVRWTRHAEQFPSTSIIFEGCSVQHALSDIAMTQEGFIVRFIQIVIEIINRVILPDAYSYVKKY